MFKNFKKSTVLLISAAFISFLLSVTLWFSGFKDEGMYVGLWVPSILALGSFVNKIISKEWKYIYFLLVFY